MNQLIQSLKVKPMKAESLNTSLDKSINTVWNPMNTDIFVNNSQMANTDIPLESGHQQYMTQNGFQKNLKMSYTKPQS